MSGLLLLGFLIGMRHALEADHLAAVAALATRAPGVAQTVRLGAVWGVGHTLTLFVVGGLFLALDKAMPDRLAAGLETAVGVMLVVLGADVLLRLRRKRVHFHIHEHADGTRHVHAHAHAPDEPHDPRHHAHAHPQAFPLRALCVGFMHGMAGSAALILLSLKTATSMATGLSFIALFGLGSVLGMAVLSLVIAVPMHYTAAGLTRVNDALQTAIGCATLALGSLVIYETALA